MTIYQSNYKSVNFNFKATKNQTRTAISVPPLISFILSLMAEIMIFKMPLSCASPQFSPDPEPGAQLDHSGWGCQHLIVILIWVSKTQRHFSNLSPKKRRDFQRSFEISWAYFIWIQFIDAQKTKEMTYWLKAPKRPLMDSNGHRKTLRINQNVSNMAFFAYIAV